MGVLIKCRCQKLQDWRSACRLRPPPPPTGPEGSPRAFPVLGEAGQMSELLLTREPDLQSEVDSDLQRSLEHNQRQSVLFGEKAGSLEKSLRQEPRCLSVDGRV